MTSASHLKIEPSAWERFKGVEKDEVRYLDIKCLGEEGKDKLRVSGSSCYRENVWDFTQEYPEYRSSDVTLNFRKIKFSDGSDITDLKKSLYLDQAKEYVYTLLVQPPWSRPKLTTYFSSIKNGLKAIFNYMFENGFNYLSELDKYDLDEFLGQLAIRNHCIGRAITNRTLTSRSQGLDWLYEQSTKMRHGLRINPFRDFGSRTQWAASAAEIALGRKESSTREMPDSVAGELVACAIKDLQLADALVEMRRLKAQYECREVTQDELPVRISGVFKEYGVYDPGSPCTERKLASRLRAAAYVIVAIFTGMRISEVQEIRFGAENNWLVQKVDIDGGIKNLHFVVTHTRKLEPRPREYHWQTIPIVQEAIEALEKVSYPFFEKGNPYLFASPRSKYSVSKTSLDFSLKAFARVHRIRHAGDIWPLASHQFRKKFARILVRQGLGLRALQDQLKHYDIEMTKVYGDPNLYAELQAEKFELSEELLEEFVGSQIPVIGGGAEELHALRKEFIGLAKKDRGAFLKSLPERALVEQTDDGLCFYRAKKALCGGDKSNCRPADCNNSWIPASGKKRTLIWRKQENERMVSFFKNQPLKVSFLRGRIEEIDKLLRQLDGPEDQP
ncbi:tyrosine-type recombinase/integrase [Marinobacter sp. NFXS11]|uniref:tyrosine-type recombinase/integrase n=1 Tax=Marinobacter sp. NFXS11 TaxID=2818432 RepID=UPI000C992D6B|nr:hypothetical protein [Rhodopirellula sp.]